LVIGSREGVRGLEIARNDGIETMVIRKSEYSDEQYREAMFEPVRRSGAQFVVMAGFLQHVLIPDDFHNRVINIHPSLLPSFGGKGMYGLHVHTAAIERGVTITGCTVHFVDNEYDHGPVIVQRACEVFPSDTAEILAARVFELECEALPAAIKKLLSDDPPR
jgi:phosphoribosylglycinamide formyltransferase-1